MRQCFDMCFTHKSFIALDIDKAGRAEESVIDDSP